MIKKVAVLSDTHIPARAERLPPEVMRLIEGVDLIIHAGDLTVPAVLDQLGSVAPVKAVRGNMDDSELLADLPLRIEFELEEMCWGVTHGMGEPDKIIERIQTVFSETIPQIVIFGHSHQPLIRQRAGSIFFNPGSPTDTEYAPYRSLGLIDVESGSIHRMEIVRL